MLTNEWSDIASYLIEIPGVFTQESIHLALIATAVEGAHAVYTHCVQLSVHLDFDSLEGNSNFKVDKIILCRLAEIYKLLL